MCLYKLNWHKDPGKNIFSPNAVKVLNIENKSKLLHFFNIWLDDVNIEYSEWLVTYIKGLPKKGDLSDPNNWIGIVLLDVVSKL